MPVGFGIESIVGSESEEPLDSGSEGLLMQYVGRQFESGQLLDSESEEERLLDQYVGRQFDWNMSDCWLNIGSAFGWDIGVTVGSDVGRAPRFRIRGIIDSDVGELLQAESERMLVRMLEELWPKIS